MSQSIEDSVAGTFFAVIIVAVVFLAGDGLYTATRRETFRPAVVVDRAYHPSQTSVGFGTSSSGQSVTTVSTTDEKYTVIFRVGDDVRSVTVEPSYWAACKPGDHATLGYRSGLFLSWCSSVRAD